MNIELSIGNDLAQLKISLSEFTTVVKHLLGEAKRQDVRQSLKEMMQEVRKSYDVAVDAFAPLYDLDTKRKFSAGFSEKRAKFKATYLKDTNKVRTHCAIVTQKLDELKKRRGWMKNLPRVRQSFKRLGDLARDWVANDTWLVNNMESLLNNMNRFLNAVSRLQQENSANAFQYLTSSLEQFEDDFLAIKKRLEVLDVLGRQV